LQDILLGSVLSIINENIEGEAISAEYADENLVSLGMNSIAFIHIIVALEETFGIEYPDEFILMSQSNTLNTIVAVVSAELTKRVRDINSELGDK
jgi:acyl carrier protein